MHRALADESADHLQRHFSLHIRIMNWLLQRAGSFTRFPRAVACRVFRAGVKSNQQPVAWGYRQRIEGCQLVYYYPTLQDAAPTSGAAPQSGARVASSCSARAQSTAFRLRGTHMGLTVSKWVWACTRYACRMKYQAQQPSDHVAVVRPRIEAKSGVPPTVRAPRPGTEHRVGPAGERGRGLEFMHRKEKQGAESTAPNWPGKMAPCNKR